MKGMKLFASPLIVRVGWRAHKRDLFQRPLEVIQPFPFPLASDHRIAECATVRSANPAAIEEGVIIIVVTPGAHAKRRFQRRRICAFMFSVAGDATDACLHVRLSDGGNEGFRLMA
jgi:hypothetical protein